jgi:hypothetical protein
MVLSLKKRQGFGVVGGQGGVKFTSYINRRLAKLQGKIYTSAIKDFNTLLSLINKQTKYCKSVDGE